MYPDVIPAATLANFASLTSDYMAKADLHVLNVLGRASSPPRCQSNLAPVHYTTYSATQLLSQPNVDAIFWYDFWSYSGLAGAVTWIDVPGAASPKPVIGGRFQLWSGLFDNVTALAEKLLVRHLISRAM